MVSADHPTIRAHYASRNAVQVIAWVLIITATLLAFLWLSEDVPALLSGTRPQSLVDLAIPTNPVHILDLSFFLPAAILTGVWQIRRQPLAYVLAPSLLVFIIMTGIPILLTPVIQTVRGEAANWGAVGPIGALTITMLGLLIWLLTTLRAPRN